LNTGKKVRFCKKNNCNEVIDWKLIIFQEWNKLISMMFKKHSLLIMAM
jgi:hypothetical protein